MKVIHPARYSDALLPALGRFLRYMEIILDPFGGTGERLGLLREFGVSTTAKLMTVEIEPEWGTIPADGVDLRIIGDATDLPFATESIEAIVTSPTYANRFADRHQAKDGSTRRSYAHDLRRLAGDEARNLHPRNTGGMQWGPAYRLLHAAAWGEAFRALCPGGLLALNISDHIRGGEIIPVTDWHLRTLQRIGFQVIAHQVEITTPRMRYGANHRARVSAESVIVFWRPPIDEDWLPVPGATPSPLLLQDMALAVAELQADELEGHAVRHLTESGREAYRDYLDDRRARKDALKLAHRAGFDPREHDAFCEDAAALRRLRVPRKLSRRRGYRTDGGDGNEAVEAIADELPRFAGLRAARDEGQPAGEILGDLFRPLLAPARGIEEFATEDAVMDMEEMMREAEEMRGTARLERLLS